MCKRLLLVTFAVLVVQVHSLSAQDRKTDEEAIRSGLREYVAAFNKGDSKALTQLLHPEYDQTNRLGMHLAGRNSFLKALDSVPRDADHRPTLSATVTSVRFLSDDIAIARGTWTASQQKTSSRGLWMSVVQRREGRWVSVSSIEMEPVAASKGQ